MLPNSLLPTLLPKPQFKAVILAGYGIDLFPLVEPPTRSTSTTTNNSNSGTNSNENESPSSSGGQTKALLPVGGNGKKMIDWVIEQIESAGILEVLVLTPQSISKPMSHHLRSRRSSSSTSKDSSKVESEEIPEEIASRGTVRVLMWATEKSLITTDFILLPCDLLLSPNSSSSSSSGISLASLLDRHRTDDNLVTTLFSTRSAGNIKDAKKQQGPVEILTIYDQSSSRLLDVREMDDLEDQDEIPLRTSLLTKYPKPTLTTSLLPTQLYIFSSLILPVLRTAAQSEPDNDDLLRRLKSFESVKDLVAWLARSNWRKNGKQDLSNYSRRSTTTTTARRNSNPSSSSSSRVGTGGELAMGRSTTQLPSSYEIMNQPIERTSGFSRSEPQTPGTTTPTPALTSRTSWLNESNSMNTTTTTTITTTNSSNMARQGRGGCKVLIWKESDGFCARGNTVSGFVELNRAALKLLPPSQTNFIPTFTSPGVFISPDSFLHPTVYTLMGEKVGIKKCIIGKNCQIGKNSKLTNSVLMEGCIIGENVKLDNCVISNGVQIRDRASLKDCELGKDVIVGSDSQLKGEQLTVGDE